MGSVTAARVAAPTLLDVIPSFERHLRAENKSPRTIQSYTEAVRRLHDFCSAYGMPLEVVNITSEHIEAFPGGPDRTAPTGQRPRTVRLSPTALRLDEKHFTFNELNFARGYEYGVVLNEAYEIARSKLEGRR